MTGRLLAGLVLPAVAVVALLVCLWAFQRRLIYLPYPRLVPPVERVLPGAREVHYRSDDGLVLRGWYLAADPDPDPAGAARPAGGAGPRPADPPRQARRGAVLLLPGNAGNRAGRAVLAAALARAGVGVLLVDYRGYGGNPGAPSEAGLAADARAARAWLAGRPEVDPERIAYFGESLGAAVALRLALEHPPAALVLRSPFTSLADVASVHYRWLPVRLLLAERYPSQERVARLSVPLLVVAGERDRVVPPEQSRRLYQAAAGPKRLVVLPGADHNDPALLAGERLLAEVTAFLRDQALPGRAGPG
jgi:fermentation-respiration switch protein FrsA (DUF1100 family)